MARTGRKPGFVMPEDVREKMAAAKIEAGERRGSVASILRALENMDREKAHALVDRFIDIRQLEMSE
jgi:hypothetical protein